MKKQKHTLLLITFLSIMLQLVMITSVLGQGNTVKLGGNNNVGLNGFSNHIGSINNADFGIISNSNLLVNFGKTGTTEFFGKVYVVKPNCTICV